VIRTLTEDLRTALVEFGFDVFLTPEPEEPEDQPYRVTRRDVTRVEVEPTWTGEKAQDKVLKRALKACFETLFPKADVWIDPLEAVSSEATLYVDDEIVDGTDFAFEVESFEEFIEDLTDEVRENSDEWSSSFSPADSKVFRRFKRML
jgi:hypothetical protein